MAHFVFELSEVWQQRVVVEADSLDEAESEALTASGNVVHLQREDKDDFEYSHTLDYVSNGREATPEEITIYRRETE
ncbi:MAG: hypothetical protein UT24_C0033G0009 [Candidatus Woesebacteria bacterium GW2011_GWB1_39_12]|uniref:Uncharacterized protein n=1 Tax=Candidatus Woesebacteria bacterium GW2011_GWB1_39_12 TaxID=1618574 RepID=A0A0G0PL48_9BACT|nr:MAG: hypothetical protein UT24_C0033G0009 [Candidatus Woesebacteria bacterium GW2011_GWB1_39_12]